MNESITVTNPGPIEGIFTIDLSPGPGVYELRGRRGSGKSTCISSIDWLAGHKVDVTLHDGAISGKVEGFGSVAPIGGRKRRKGEFTLDTIDAEKFSLIDLIDPPGKTPEVRDAHAIKALAVLGEAKADAALYYDLAGGQAEFDALGIAPTDDPVLLATRIKQAFDKAARERQNTAEAEASHALPLEHVPEGLDMTGSADLTELGKVRDAARDEHQRVTIGRREGLAKEAGIEQASLRLSKIEEEYTGPTVDEAADALETQVRMKVDAARKVSDLTRELEQAQVALAAADVKCIAGGREYDAAQSFADAVEQLQAIASEQFTYPEEAAVLKALEAVGQMSMAYDQGVQIRDVMNNHGKATAHRAAAKHAEARADEARNKAAQVFDILAQSLHTSHLSIESVDGNPRLFVQHPRRGKTAFDRVNGLSDGERVDFTLRELIPHLDSPGILPIPQRIWQDLQPTDRINLHKLAVEKGLCIVGAQVDDGELRVVYFGAKELEK